MEQEVESSKLAEANPAALSYGVSLPVFRSAHKGYDRLEILEANRKQFPDGWSWIGVKNTA
eukprot:scaffold3014_cov116-Cylindrotheca_fusiformis.AAC.7